MQHWYTKPLVVLGIGHMLKVKNNPYSNSLLVDIWPNFDASLEKRSFTEVVTPLNMSPQRSTDPGMPHSH
jgi:hypothetical protein